MSIDDDDDYDDGDVGWRQTEEQLNTVIGSDSGGNLIVGGRRGCAARPMRLAFTREEQTASECHHRLSVVRGGGGRQVYSLNIFLCTNRLW